MNVLFLSIGDFDSIHQHALYPDLLREFSKNGHNVYVVCSRERRKNLPTELIDDNGAKILKVRIGNITKTNIIEKGISTILVEYQYQTAIKKFLSDVKFDLVMYSTPPITFEKVVKYIKNRDGAKSYLLLKDIFPQNAVDIGMMSKSGLSGMIYRFFRMKEKRLYALSDRIGCMSEANRDYVLKNNSEVSADAVGICPNCIDVREVSLKAEERAAMREKYGIPKDKKVYVYGGNLGKPQDIPFVIECIKKSRDVSDVFFLIVGDGTEYSRLEAFYTNENPQNMKLMQRLPGEDYDRMIAACDAGLIFLDHRFTIPNFPSRILTYMQACLPVIACTDKNTDLGKIIIDGGFGWWCESDDAEKVVSLLKASVNADLSAVGKKGFEYLNDNYLVESAYETIVSEI